MAKVINFFGGPGASKSTIAAYTFSMLKFSGVNAELITEYAKDKTWEGSLKVLENQIYVFGKQQHKLHRVQDKVDVAIMDSPLLLSAVYDPSGSQVFKQLILDEFHKYNNLNILLTRDPLKNYCTAGRSQTKQEAMIIDEKVKFFLDDNNIKYYSFVGNKDSADKIVNLIKGMLR